MTIAIAGPRLQAEISENGAELVRLRDAQGRDLLWDGDPAFWTGRSPLLFPIVGQVRNNRIRVGGSEYELFRHGFARTSRFEAVEAGPSQCRLRLISDEATLRRYPFPFRLDVAYRIAEETLTMTASVTNTGNTDMPVSFGFHPAFRWPLPYGAAREAHEIRFEREEGAPIRRPLEGLIGRQPLPSPVQGRALRLNDSLFAADALVFDRLESRSVTYGAPGSGSIRVDFPCMTHLGIWTKPGAGFICIEPWQGYADPEDFDGEFSEKPGLVLIQPGIERDFGMSVTVNGAAL
ncbi:galactose mutarotase-like enzyme [Microvirga flocculans]|uniref:Galactose mutarotase-like enzyme n=1 Tax=Microvirga flocculans TaxID=217168 RepID=A0A7W6IGI3_9HYPH|nr:aldose 1-epimerase family protein [Microvirga flocculans]MBB4040736.1 galactose mutarotase-like enzyme [Microvirga flocculans]